MVMGCGVPTHVLGPSVCRPKTCFGTPRRLNNHELDGVAHKVPVIYGVVKSIIKKCRGQVIGSTEFISLIEAE